MRTPDIEGVAIHDGPSHASASVRALGLLDFDGPRGTSAASPRVRCRALFTCLDFERADLDQVDSVARIDESSAFGLTVITMSGVASRGASMRRRLPASIVALVSACAVLAGCSTDSGVNAQTLESTGPATSVSLTAGSSGVGQFPGSGFLRSCLDNCCSGDRWRRVRPGDRGPGRRGSPVDQVVGCVRSARTHSRRSTGCPRWNCRRRPGIDEHAHGRPDPHREGLGHLWANRPPDQLAAIRRRKAQRGYRGLPGLKPVRVIRDKHGLQADRRSAA